MGPEPDVPRGETEARHGVSSSIVLALIVLLEVLGNACLSRGMRAIGAVALTGPAAVGHLVAQALTSPWVLVGIFILLGYFLAYMTALSRMDLSYVLPITASNYVLTAVIAWAALGERISDLRWAGTFLICAGLVVIRRGERAPAALSSDAMAEELVP